MQHNRTTALFSHATVIMAAGEKSGTQRQAWEEIRLGRAPFLHESVIHSTFEWLSKLLPRCATPVTWMEDLLADPLLHP